MRYTNGFNKQMHAEANLVSDTHTLKGSRARLRFLHPQPPTPPSQCVLLSCCHGVECILKGGSGIDYLMEKKELLKWPCLMLLSCETTSPLSRMVEIILQPLLMFNKDGATLRYWRGKKQPMASAQIGRKIVVRL